MTPERWRKVNEIFHAALEQSSDPEKFLESACGTDPELHAEVLQMIQQHERCGFLDQPPWRAAAAPLFAEGEILAGRRIRPSNGAIFNRSRGMRTEMRNTAKSTSTVAGPECRKTTAQIDNLSVRRLALPGRRSRKTAQNKVAPGRNAQQKGIREEPVWFPQT